MENDILKKIIPPQPEQSCSDVVHFKKAVLKSNLVPGQITVKVNHCYLKMHEWQQTFVEPDISHIFAHFND